MDPDPEIWIRIRAVSHSTGTIINFVKKKKTGNYVFTVFPSKKIFKKKIINNNGTHEF